MKRKLPYFTIYSTDFCAYTRHLTKAQIGELVCAINDVALGYEKPKLTEKIEKVWKIFEDRLIEDLEKYKAKIDRSQKGGAARGRQQAAVKLCQPEPEPYIPPIVPQTGDDKFDKFWEIFPRARRGNRQKALTAWRKAIGRETPEAILTGLASYCKSDEVRRGFAKGAAAWLNDDRWACQYGTADDWLSLPQNKMPSPAGG